jgi:prepilin-type N-terminal cleavage/methylation domain-containing protein
VNALRRVVARRRDDDGVSLTELLVAIMVFGIVLAVVSTTFVSLTKATAQARAIDGNTRVASNVMNDLARTIRAARTIPRTDGTQAASFTAASTEGLTLTSAVNTADSSTTVPRQVTFRIGSDRTLVSSSIVATTVTGGFYQFTSPATTRTLGGAVVTTASSGTPLFGYLDFAGDPLAPDASGTLSATQLSSIAAVTITLTIDRTSTLTSQAVTLQNTVSLSNLAGGVTT